MFSWILCSQEEKQILFSQLSVNDGLSQNSVVSIAQDETGYLWFATQDGLNKYNGIDFEYFPILFDDITKEDYSTLGTIFIDNENSIYAISKGGILQKINAKQKIFQKINRFKKVSAIYQSKDGSLWIGTNNNGGYKIDGVSKDTIPFLFNEEALTHIYAIDSYKGKIVTATSGAILIVDPNNLRSKQKLTQDAVNFSSFSKAEDTLWIGSYGKGLYYTSQFYSLKLFKGFSKKHRLPENLNILSLHIDSKERLWVGTYGNGAFLLDFKIETIQHFKPQPKNPKAIHYNDILSIFEDHTGTIWLGTDGAGLSYYDENLSKFNTLTNYQTPENTFVDVARAITVTENGEIAIGTSGKGLTFYNPNTKTFKSYQHSAIKNSISSNRIMSLLADTPKLWIGYQDEGLSVFYPKENRFSHFSEKSNPPLNAQTIWCIFKDSKNRMWLGTRDNGLILFDETKGVLKKYTSNTENSNSISENNIRTITEAEDGNLWIGTENQGINKFFIDKEIFKRYSIDDIKNIKSIFENNDILWIGTNGKGLQAIDLTTEKTYSYTLENGLPNNVIYGILSDRNNNLWLSSNRGITRFAFKNFNESPDIVSYDMYDGLQALEFNTGAYYMDKNSKLYFGGLKGINWFSSSEISSNQKPPKTIIYQINLFNEKISIANNSSFKNNENSISFYFAGLHYSQPEQNEYKYILENYDTQWSTPSNENHANYTNLEPEDYTFKVLSSNYDGIWDSTPATYSFTINAPWYATLWAKTGYLIAFIFILFLAYRYLKWKWKLELDLKLELQETERLVRLDELKTKLYTNISHEFRTPLTLISGPVQQLITTSELNESDKTSVEIIERSSNRMLLLVNQMLDLSKLEEGSVILKIGKHNLKFQLLQLLEAFTLSANEKGIKIDSTIAAFNEVWYDKDIMEKVVSNLLSNAIKYAPENEIIHFSATNEGAYVIIEVENINTTISEEMLPKLFERFYQMDTNSPGTGIGLSLIKELAIVSRGSITAVKKDKNTISFIAKLPISKELYNENEIKPKFEPLVPEQSETIFNSEKEEKPILLIVEDNVELKNYIVTLFSDSYKILKAKDGMQGIKKAIETIPDIIISDIMMPKKDGIELTNTLKNDVRTNHIPIILLTAKTGDQNKLKGLTSKADDYITKPFNTEILKQKVINCLETRRLLQEKYSNNLYLKPKEVAFNDVDEVLLEQIQEIIDTKITDPDYTSALFAKDLALSRMQLHRKLKALTGLTTSEFIKSQRLKASLPLLKSSQLTISEIAYSVGFNSVSYFSTCFKETYHVPPTEYK